LKIKLLFLIILVILVISGYYYSIQQNERVIISLTTSVNDSGLAYMLEEKFEEYHPDIDIQIIASGTGKALEIARRGDADLVLVHNRQMEEEFVENGIGEHRITLMYNNFVLIGPESDPLSISGNNITAALEKMALTKNVYDFRFISRGDLSGTHQFERLLWSKIGIEPTGMKWYIETSSGMGNTLRIADEKEAYVIIDSGTWQSLKDGKNLVVLSKDDPDTINPYSLIIVSKNVHPNVNYSGAEKFILFLISEEGQRNIGNFKKNNEILFTPIFGKPELIGLQSEKDSIEYWEDRLYNQ